jgi:hypothetical protein
MNALDPTGVDDGKDPNLVLFELYLGTAEKVSDRRAVQGMGEDCTLPV